MSAAVTKQPGSNLPTMAEHLPKALVEQMVDAALIPVKAQADVLVGSCGDFLADHKTIENDEQRAVATEVLVTVAAFGAGKNGVAERAREIINRPVIVAGEVIGSAAEGPFARQSQRVKIAAASIKMMALNYDLKKEADARATAQAEADRLAAASALAEKLAASGSGLFDFAEASETASQAEAQQTLATGKAAELTRSRGANFGTTSVRYARKAIIVDAAAVPRQFCIPDQSLIDKRRGDPETTHNPADGWKRLDGGAWERPSPDVPGVMIRDTPYLTIRE
jgi:hypothetical protein